MISQAVNQHLINFVNCFMFPQNGAVYGTCASRIYKSCVVYVEALILGYNYMWVDLWKGLLYMHPILQLWRSITSFVAALLSQKCLSFTCNDRKVMLPNCKAAGQTEAELHLKMEELNVCIYKPSFSISGRILLH